MKRLTQSTLLFWLICFILGLLVYAKAIEAVFLICCAVIFLTGCVFWVKNYTWVTYFVFAPLFAVLGYLSIQKVFPQENDFLSNGENYYVGKVIKRFNENATWNTNLVELQAGLNQDETWVRTIEKIILITEKKELEIRENDLLLFHTDFTKISNQNNPGEFDSETYWLSKGVRYQGFGSSDQLKIIENIPFNYFENQMRSVRKYADLLFTKWIGNKEAPLIKAIFLGDKNDLDIETKTAFMNAGAMHMLAVSGMHVGLIVVILGLFFKYLFLLKGRIWEMLFIVFFIWCYAFLTGFSASVTRAVVMFTLLIIATWIKREYQPFNALSIAAFIILVFDPMSIYDIGFQLSFLAMIGIFLVYPRIENGITIQNKLVKKLWQGTTLGIAAQTFTLPICLFYFKQFPNYFMITNLGIILFSGILLGLAIGLLVVGKITILSMPIGWLLALCTSIFISFVSVIELLPGAVATGFNPTITWTLLMYVIIIISLLLVEKQKWLYVILITIPMIFWIQYDRLKNFQKSEFLIFNSDYPTFLINKKGKQICLYQGNEKGLKQAKRLVNDYQRIHTGKSEFIPIEVGSYSIQTGEYSFIFKPNNGFIKIAINGETYQLITSTKYATNKAFDHENAKSIAMKNQSSNRLFYSLTKGSFKISLQ